MEKTAAEKQLREDMKGVTQLNVLALFVLITFAPTGDPIVRIAQAIQIGLTLIGGFVAYEELAQRLTGEPSLWKWAPRMLTALLCVFYPLVMALVSLVAVTGVGPIAGLAGTVSHVPHRVALAFSLLALFSSSLLYSAAMRQEESSLRRVVLAWAMVGAFVLAYLAILLGDQPIHVVGAAFYVAAVIFLIVMSWRAGIAAMTLKNKYKSTTAPVGRTLRQWWAVDF